MQKKKKKKLKTEIICWKLLNILYFNEQNQQGKDFLRHFNTKPNA